MTEAPEQSPNYAETNPAKPTLQENKTANDSTKKSRSHALLWFTARLAEP